MSDRTNNNNNNNVSDRGQGSDDDEGSRKQRKQDSSQSPGSSVSQQEEQEEEQEEQHDEVQRNAFLRHLLNAMLVNRAPDARTNEELIQSLKDSNVLSTPKVEDAFLTIPRSAFVPKELAAEAYEDAPLRVATMGFNISAPHMYVVCLEKLDLKMGMSFLDVGSGCGHMTALASYLVGKDGLSHGLDLRDDIVKFAQQNLQVFAEASGIDFSNVRFFVRNCFLPTLHNRTYDRIHVGACCPEANLDYLISLLNPNGILVTPYGDRLIRVIKDSKGQCKTEKLMAVRYGDLVVPSEAEVKEALRAIEKEKANTILVPESTYATDFSKLFNNSQFSDVTLIVEGKSIPAHKVILATRSQHFAAMLFGGLKESREAQITLNDIPYDLFLDCLKFIYSDSTYIRSPDHAIELMPLVNYFKLDRLKATCENVIRSGIDIENAAYILQVASRHEAWQLKKFALNFIMENYDQVSNTKSFDELDKPLLLEVTKEACKFAKS